MLRYRIYKDSNVEWLREVPNHWKVEKIKRRMSFKYGSALKEENRVEGNFKVFGSNGIVGTHQFGITEGETIIIGRKGTAGALNFCYESCYPIDTAYYIDKNASAENLRFLFYALMQLDLELMNEDSAVPGLSRENAYQKKLSFPPKTEQTAIANYLDQATKKIGNVVTIKKKQLEELEQYKKSRIYECVTKGLNADAPMKPSSVEWIGDVPGHWKVEKIKRRMNFVYGSALKEENRKEGEFNVYGSNGIVGTHEFGITDGETIIIGRKGTAGALKYSYESCYPIDTAYFIDKTATQENIRFLFYALQTLDLDQMNEDSAVPGLSRENAYEKKLGFPLKAEQKQIAGYLDDFCNKIAKEKNIIEKQIICLQQYRKSLIHECVTGKRKVTDD